jgi:hypothetical protein
MAIGRIDSFNASQRGQGLLEMIHSGCDLLPGWDVFSLLAIYSRSIGVHTDPRLDLCLYTKSTGNMFDERF